MMIRRKTLRLNLLQQVRLPRGKTPRLIPRLLTSHNRRFG